MTNLKRVMFLETISGTVWRITYRNENSYTIAKLKVAKQKDLISIVGYIPLVYVGSVLTIKGKWVINSQFGRQFQISESEETMPADITGIQIYLSSGMIKGLGPQTAKKIVSYYKENTLKVMESNPDLLLKVKGVNHKLIVTIKETWQQQKEIKDIIEFLKKVNINTLYATPIHKKYGKDSINVLSKDLYKLVDDIPGIGFETVDKAALEFLHIDKESYIRCRAGVLYTLNRISNNGHCFANLEQVSETGSNLLNIESEKLVMTIGHMNHTKEVITEDSFSAIYLPSLYYSEIVVANLIKKILATPRKKEIQDTSLNTKIKYDAVQKKCIQYASKEKFMLLTGGPGTGKTTTISGIIDLFKRNKFKILLAAPTVRAAKRMTETTKMPAKTIHRLLEYNPQSGYKKSTENKLKGDILIIDESSMIDIVMMNSLLKAVPAYMTVIMVGDVDQLPSIGSGNVLKDIIESNAVTTIKLEKVYRQAQKSKIIENAHKINKGIFPELKNGNHSDFFFIQENDEQKLQNLIKDLVTHRLPNFYKVGSKENIFVLAPLQKGTLGVEHLNLMLQDALNTNTIFITYKGKKFKVNDKVMQIQNNYDKDVYNGDIGTISSIDFKSKSIYVTFDERRIKYKLDELDELNLAYAMTIHKSQGSEFPIVVLPLSCSYGTMLQGNLLYTAVTRAKKALVIVGEKEAISLAINNNKSEKRSTKLKDRLRTRF